MQFYVETMQIRPTDFTTGLIIHFSIALFALTQNRGLTHVPVTYADSSALEADYGFRPTIGIREGLRKIAQWYAEYYK